MALLASERIHQVACGSKAWHLGMLSSEVAGLEITLADTQQQLASALQRAEQAEAREKVLREGLVVYADANWERSRNHNDWSVWECTCGPQPAQAALAKYREMGGEG